MAKRTAPKPNRANSDAWTRPLGAVQAPAKPAANPWAAPLQDLLDATAAKAARREFRRERHED